MNYFYGKNGFSDVEFWKPHYPSDINSIIQPKNAVEIIRDLAMKVNFFISMPIRCKFDANSIPLITSLLKSFISAPE